MTDRLVVHRQEIQRNLEEARAGYPGLWMRVTQAWRDSAVGNYTWLTYAANYLFSFNGFKWALDPFSMSYRVSGVPAPDYRQDLADLSLIVLTHAHNDHLDISMVRELADTSVQWVIPPYVLEKIEAEVKLPRDRVTVPRAGEEIEFGPLRLLPFESLHMNGAHGVPEMGYLVAFDDQRWLFPGDIRNYQFDGLPAFGRLDGIVAHLWLGKARAMDEMPPLLQAFCDFFVSFDTTRLVITHLNEFGRDEQELWRESHFKLVREEILRRNPDMQVEKAVMGERIVIDR